MCWQNPKKGDPTADADDGAHRRLGPLECLSELLEGAGVAAQRHLVTH